MESSVREVYFESDAHSAHAVGSAQGDHSQCAVPVYLSDN